MAQIAQMDADSGQGLYRMPTAGRERPSAGLVVAHRAEPTLTVVDGGSAASRPTRVASAAALVTHARRRRARRSEYPRRRLRHLRRLHLRIVKERTMS